MSGDTSCEALSESPRKKLRRRGVRLRNYTWFASIVELQRQLYVPGWLGRGDLSHGRTQAHVWCIKLGVVEGIDEVSPELQSEALRQLEVFV